MSKTIMVDIGHGGTDNGASAFGVREKDWNLKMGLLVYRQLRDLGVRASISRVNDRSLGQNERIKMIKDKFDYCVSIHFNAFNGKARGIETIHSIFGGKGFATRIANELVKESGLPLRRVFSKSNAHGTDWYYMQRLTGKTRTVIVEYGFLDNQTDHNFYKNENNFKRMADATVRAICDELGVEYNKKQTKEGGNVMYKVQTGAFNDIKNAESLAKELEKDGYSTYIVYDGLAPAPQEKRKSVEEMADIIEKAGIKGNSERAKHLGLTLEEYQPVRQELNRRYQ